MQTPESINIELLSDMVELTNGAITNVSYGKGDKAHGERKNR